MAAMVRSMVMRRKRLALPSCLLQGSRHSHRQTMWEQILGKKIAPSTVKALEEAYTEFRVSKSVPSWLPFHPNSSFWIPSYEVTLNTLEELLEALQRAQSASRKRQSCPSFTASAELADDGISSSKALSAIQVTDQLVDKLQDIPLENGTKIILVDVSGLDQGRHVIEEIDEDEDEDDDDDDDGDDEIDDGEDSEDDDLVDLKAK